MAKECGLAKNTASAQLFLDQCEAVIEVVELNAEWLEFSYDPTVEVSVVPDHIVWFDQGSAPVEGLAVLNEFHNGETKMAKTNKFITISTDPTAWGDTTTAPDFNVDDEVAKIRETAESQGIEVLLDEQPQIVYNADGTEKDNIDWFTTWCREGYLWTDAQWREWFAN